MPWTLLVIQRIATSANTSSISHSDHFMRPIAVNSCEASSLAAGVCLISGGNTRYSTHGTSNKLKSAGTMAAMAQHAYVISIPVTSFANRAMMGLDAWPVRNIAQTMTLHW